MGWLDLAAEPLRRFPSFQRANLQLASMVPASSPLYGVAAPWIRWDSLWYLSIARSGYTLPREAVFSPLYPGAIHVVATVLGFPLAALILSFIGYLIGLIYFDAYVRSRYGEAIARRADWVLILFPTSFYFATGYAEAFAFAGIAATLFYLEKGSWAGAACSSLLATLSRPLGILVAIPILAKAAGAKGKDRIVGFLACCVPLAAFLCVEAYLRARFGFANLLSAETLWDTHVVAPWTSIPRSIAYMVQGDADEILNVCALALVIATAASRKIAGRGIRLFVVAMAIPMAFEEAAGIPFLSDIRYILLVVPVFITLARLPVRRSIARIALAMSFAGQAVLFLSYVQFHFVG